MKTLQFFSVQGPSATSASQRVVTRMNSKKSSHVFKAATYIKQWSDNNNSSEITYPKAPFYSVHRRVIYNDKMLRLAN